MLAGVPWWERGGRAEVSGGWGWGQVVVVVFGVLGAVLELVVAVVGAARASWGAPLRFSLWSFLGLFLAFA